MEIVLFVLGAILGGLISWGIAHTYYAKSSRDQKAVFNKLTKEVRSIILQDKRESLTVQELNELLEKKTIKNPIGDDPLPYKACPKCGSENLRRGELFTQDDSYYVIQCADCQWSDWTQ
jgi:hypothetical protein